MVGVYAPTYSHTKNRMISKEVSPKYEIAKVQKR